MNYIMTRMFNHRAGFRRFAYFKDGLSASDSAIVQRRYVHLGRDAEPKRTYRIKHIVITILMSTGVNPMLTTGNLKKLDNVSFAYDGMGLSYSRRSRNLICLRYDFPWTTFLIWTKPRPGTETIKTDAIIPAGLSENSGPFYKQRLHQKNIVGDMYHHCYSYLLSG